MSFVIDRFEGDFAIVEDEKGNLYEIPKPVLSGFVEGESFLISKTENKNRADKIKNLADELFG